MNADSSTSTIESSYFQIEYSRQHLLRVDQDPKAIVRFVIPNREQAMEYCCLRHRWGQLENAGKLIHSNLLQRLSISVKLGSLPRTFQDAVTITRELGISYLWIDSLCIQDSEQDWLYEARSMDRIFEGTICTIAAAGARNSG